MKINTLQIIISVITLTSCGSQVIEKKLSSDEIISKSIDFHDPHQSWCTFHATMNFESSFSWNDSIPEHMELTFDNKQQYFNYLNHDRKVDLHYYPDSCSKASTNGDCGGYSWTYGFYPYIWGLPMKLQDPGIKPEKEFRKMVFNNESVYEVQVNYKAENFWFYFNDDDFQLEAFKFIKNDTTGKGEIVVLKNLKEVNGIKFPQHRTWLHLDSSLIGVNELK